MRIATLRIRQKISANRHADALNLTWATLREQGYDPDHLTTDNMIVPRTVAEVEDMVFTDDPVDVDDVRLLLLSLWGEYDVSSHVLITDHRSLRWTYGLCFEAK